MLMEGRMEGYIPRRMMIKLTPDVSQGLLDLARAEGRDPRDQAALLIRQGLDGKRITGALPALEQAVLTQVAKDEGLGSIGEALGLVIREWVTARMVRAGVTDVSL